MAEQRTLDAERADFEAWAKPQPYWWNGQSYSDLHTQVAWDAWQAARRAPPVLDAEELPEGEDHPALLKIMDDILTPSGWKKYKADEEIALFPEHFRDIFKAGLRAQLARTSAPEGAPAGMVLVPVEPTEAMVHAAEDLPAPRMFGKVWRAMIAAAPTSASAQPADQNKMEKNDE